MTKFKAHTQSFCRACYAHKIGKGEPCKKHSPTGKPSKEFVSHLETCSGKTKPSTKSESVCDKHAKMTMVQPCDHKTSSKSQCTEEIESKCTKEIQPKVTKSNPRTRPIEIDDLQLDLELSNYQPIRTCPFYNPSSPLCNPSRPPPNPPPGTLPPNPGPIRPPPPNPNPPPNPSIVILQQENDQLRQQLILLQQQNENLSDQCQQNIQNTFNEMNEQAQRELEIQAQQQRELELAMLSERFNGAIPDSLNNPTSFLPATSAPKILNYELLPSAITENRTLSDLTNSIQVCSSQVPNGTSSNPNSPQGYWTLDQFGNVKAYGNARCYGSLSSYLNSSPQLKAVGMAITPTRQGYWIATEDGEVYAFGDAKFVGSASSYRLNKPIVGIQSTGTGNGYWLMTSNGGIMGFGDASFQGSESSTFKEFQTPLIGIFS